MFFLLSLGPRADQAAAFPPPAWSLTAPTDMGSRQAPTQCLLMSSQGKLPGKPSLVGGGEGT